MNKFSLRCGRILPDDGEHMWRWTGFYSGLDLVWTSKNRCIKVRRNHRNNDVGSMLSMAKRRYVVCRYVKLPFFILFFSIFSILYLPQMCCRLTIAKLNNLKQIEFIEKSPIKTLRLHRHEEVCICYV